MSPATTPIPADLPGKPGAYGAGDGGLNGKLVEDAAVVCAVCHSVMSFHHDHKPDQSGLDDGPWLPGHAPRKKHDIDPAAFSAARKRAWETRRVKYGPRGHS